MRSSLLFERPKGVASQTCDHHDTSSAKDSPSTMLNVDLLNLEFRLFPIVLKVGKSLEVGVNGDLLREPFAIAITSGATISGDIKQPFVCPIEERGGAASKLIVATRSFWEHGLFARDRIVRPHKELSVLKTPLRIVSRSPSVHLEVRLLARKVTLALQRFTMAITKHQSVPDFPSV